MTTIDFHYRNSGKTVAYYTLTPFFVVLFVFICLIANQCQIKDNDQKNLQYKKTEL